MSEHFENMDIIVETKNANNIHIFKMFRHQKFFGLSPKSAYLARKINFFSFFLDDPCILSG
jgi:hypothetical protein